MGKILTSCVVFSVFICTLHSSVSHFLGGTISWMLDDSKNSVSDVSLVYTVIIVFVL